MTLAISAQDAPGILKLSFGTPVRVEVLDAEGKSKVASDALLIGGD